MDRPSANSYCPTNFDRRAFLLQSFKGSCYRIRCTVTGGAYLSARRVSSCVRNNYRIGTYLNRTRRTHQTRPSTLFFPIFSLAREKIGPPEARRKRPRRNESPRYARSLLSSEPVSSFPKHKRFAGLCFGAGLDGTSPRAAREASYPLSPFPPFQNINASLVYVLGLASTERVPALRAKPLIL